MVMKSVDIDIGLNYQDKSGRTALHVACENGQLKIVELFLQKSSKLNIDLNAEDNKGMTPMDYAEINKHIEIKIKINQSIIERRLSKRPRYF